MARRKYLHISYIAGYGDGEPVFKSCVAILTTGDYDELYEVLKKDYCEKERTKPEGLMLSIISLNEISKGTYKILNGGKI